ncbi:DNA adenine methylase [Ruminococcus sp.]|uniref:DNA adenine methylase n=1 Tax=Ruminococcus sp. TaxID=41978 RepID=UPI0025CE587E|nr:DNA adenine methylase [Ruminococcus sp.]
MDYLTIKEASDKWGLSVRRVQTLCSEEQIAGAIRFSGVWAIPVTAQRPIDHRIKTGRYIKSKENYVTPILKWAGGKTQLLPDILERMPETYNGYMEPFIGGGALFFRLNSDKSIIADSNPELINMYRTVANHCDLVIEELKKYRNEEEMFYEVRAKDWTLCNNVEAAARMIYLNRTCFNGLYRLNKKGQFNTPFGKYKNPTICNEEKLYAASEVLKRAKIICGDYLDVLESYAQEDDFIFLDPPYVPVSEYADFKRYTKEQFYESDQRNLAEEVHRLVAKGCKVMLTNSNHPLVHELYGRYKIDVIQTKRNINRNGDRRNGEDVIVTTYR